MRDKSFSSKRFKKVGLLTIASVYFLILVGGIVRSTGSGMGCPDWPKCFGTWVPPTSLNQLPSDYLQVYKEKRVQKNERIANLLQSIGLTEVAEEIFAHPSQYIESEFNATKTWIEYVNRLIGVLIGIFIFLTVLFSLPFFKSDPKVFWGALLSFVLVGFQGWLGSLVVSTNLLPELVTLHMALALVLLAVLIYIVLRVQREQLFQSEEFFSGKLSGLIGIVLVLTFLQVILGTQVREEIDIISFNLQNQQRSTWIEQLGASFYVHRSASILVVLLNGLLFYLVRQTGHKRLLAICKGILVVIGFEILLGIILSYFALPAFAQPLHLLFGTLLFGQQFWLWMSYYYTYKPSQASPESVA